jgi:hypothetical protein
MSVNRWWDEGQKEAGREKTTELCQHTNPLLPGGTCTAFVLGRQKKLVLSVGPLQPLLPLSPFLG